MWSPAELHGPNKVKHPSRLELGLTTMDHVPGVRHGTYSSCAPQEGQCCVDASPCPMARSTSTTLLSPSTQQHRQCHTSPQLPTGARRQWGAGGNVDAKPVSSYSLSISAFSSQQALQQESNGGLRAVTISGVTGYFKAGKIINLCLQNSVPNCS